METVLNFDPNWLSAIAAIISVGIITWQTILSRKSIKHMEKQTELSAKSVEDMKEQRKFEYKKLEMCDLKHFINENIISYIKNYKQAKSSKSDKLDIKLIEKVNHEIYTSIIQLAAHSANTFYNEDICILERGIRRLVVFTTYPENYSYKAKSWVSALLTKIGDNLYQILTNKDNLNEYLKIIKEESDEIYQQLTEEEKCIVEKDLANFLF